MPSRLKKKSSWSAEDSKAEMSRWVSHKPPTDPAVTAIQKTLEANMEYFLDHVATISEKYQEHLTKTLQLNPKAAAALKRPEPMFKATPLLERQESTVKEGEGADATTADKLGTHLVKLPKEKLTEEEKAKEEKARANAPRVVDDERGRRIILKKVKEGESGPDDESSSDSDASSDDYDPSPDAEKPVFPDNTVLLEQIRLQKREAYELGTTFDGIHDWIALNIPDLKDEDNMGVQVMGAVLEQAQSLNSTIKDVYSLEGSYLEERADYEMQAEKYPDSRTSKQALQVLDDNTWDDVGRNWRSMIRCVLILYSMIHKNFDKLKNPRKQSGHSLYSM